jgi:hypothetical protein
VHLQTFHAKPRAILVALALLTALAFGCPPPDEADAAPQLGKIETALQEPAFFSRPRDRYAALDHAKHAGTTWIKVDIEWNVIAPDGDTRPPGLVASDPGDPNYRWSRLDALILDATERGLRPFVSIHRAPRWAERPSGGARGTNNPPVQEAADF